MNKRKVKGANNYPKKNNLVDSKNLERNIVTEISKELTDVKTKPKTNK